MAVQNSSSAMTPILNAWIYLCISESPLKNQLVLLQQQNQSELKSPDSFFTLNFLLLGNGSENIANGDQL
jgi:hypothetical protein